MFNSRRVTPAANIYQMPTLVSTAQITITDQNDYIFSGTTPPPNPIANVTLWNDTSVTPILQKLWTGTAWEVVNKVSSGSMVIDVDGWKLNNQTIEIVADGKQGNRVLRISTKYGYPNSGQYIPIVTSRQYKTRFWARASADCNGFLYFSLRQFVSEGVGCAINGGRYPYRPGALTAHQDWRIYEYDWSTSHWQDGVKYVLPEFLNNYSGTAGYWEVQGFAMYDITDIVQLQVGINQAVTDQRAYIDGAFKDGVITQAEAQSIDKLNKDVNSKYNALINDYNVVFANAYLEGVAKADLLNAKVSLAGAKDALQNSINVAVSDGKTTTAEKADVDSKFTAYDTAFAAYQTKLSLANKAIQIKGVEDAKAKAAETDYLKAAMKAYSGADGGLLFAALLRMGIFDANGSGTTQAFVNGTGTAPLDPIFGAGGDLAAAVRLVNEVVNGTPATGAKASSVITRDGKMIATAGYIAAFKILGQLLSCGQLELGMIDGVPKIRIKDSTRSNQTSVEIGDFDLTDPSLLSGGGNVDVTPSYSYVSTAASLGTFWLTQSGISTNKTPLSTGVTAGTAYQLLFTLIASNSTGNNSSEDIRINENWSYLDATFTISAKDASDTILAAVDMPFAGTSTDTYKTYLLDKTVALGLTTKVSGDLYIEIKLNQTSYRFRYEDEILPPIGYLYDSQTNFAVKINTKIQLTSGKGLIEIARGFQAIYSSNKYFQIQNKAGVPLLRAKGDFMFNECTMQDLLLQFWATGVAGYTLNIQRWQGHESYTSKTQISISRTGVGRYTITHNMKLKGIINNEYDYYVTGSAYGRHVSIGAITDSTTEIVTSDDNSPNDATRIFIQFWSLKNWQIT